MQPSASQAREVRNAMELELVALKGALAQQMAELDLDDALPEESPGSPDVPGVAFRRAVHLRGFVSTCMTWNT